MDTAASISQRKYLRSFRIQIEWQRNSYDIKLFHVDEFRIK